MIDGTAKISWFLGLMSVLGASTASCFRRVNNVKWQEVRPSLHICQAYVNNVVSLSLIFDPQDIYQ